MRARTLVVCGVQFGRASGGPQRVRLVSVTDDEQAAATMPTAGRSSAPDEPDRAERSPERDVYAAFRYVHLDDRFGPYRPWSLSLAFSPTFLALPLT